MRALSLSLIYPGREDMYVPLRVPAARVYACFVAYRGDFGWVDESENCQEYDPHLLELPRLVLI